jgi:hypothetical protein
MHPRAQLLSSGMVVTNNNACTCMEGIQPSDAGFRWTLAPHRPVLPPPPLLSFSMSFVAMVLPPGNLQKKTRLACR